MADNADITQSQARDTRHRRMQEVSSLCRDSLWVEYCIVFIPDDTAVQLFSICWVILDVCQYRDINNADF